MQWWALRYLLQKASDNIALLNSIDLIQRTAEMARVFGIDFAAPRVQPYPISHSAASSGKEGLRSSIGIHISTIPNSTT